MELWVFIRGVEDLYRHCRSLVRRPRRVSEDSQYSPAIADHKSFSRGASFMDAEGKSQQG